MPRKQAWSALSILFVVAAIHPAASQAQFHSTVVVSPFPSSPGSSGNALLIALANITDASATKPYLIKLEPGFYYIGTSRLLMKPYVDIEGSGKERTIIEGTGNAPADVYLNGVVVGAQPAEIRNLTVRCFSSSAASYAIPIFLPGVATRITDVATFSASPPTGVSYGIRILSASPTLDRVDITVANAGGAGSVGYGIVSTGMNGGHPVIRRTVIVAYGATDEYGLYCDQRGAPQEIRDLQIFASGTYTRGIYFATEEPFYLTRLTNSRIEINGSSTNIGIERDHVGSIYVELSQIRASAGSSSNIGILNGLSSPLLIDHSEITAATATVSGPALIGAAKLIGGPAVGAQCAGVYDENYTFFPGLSCP